ncbi:hypothetical protein BJV77DRAFT_1003877 [Russula vinacea]|nr:hypothetical protein BJV77DRAFT_1003877 [Russula vinacea]
MRFLLIPAFPCQILYCMYADSYSPYIACTVVSSFSGTEHQEAVRDPKGIDYQYSTSPVWQQAPGRTGRIIL